MGNKQGNFSSKKLEVVLKRALIRLELIINKKASAQPGLKEELVALHHSGKLSLADLKAESLIVNENTISVLVHLKRTIENIINRRDAIEKSRPCLADMREDISFLIYCNGRCECDELREAKSLFANKYGDSFCQKAQNNTGGVINEELVEKLRFDNILESTKRRKVDEIMSRL